MPTRTFAITADDKPVALDAQGCGEITITVANTATRPIRGLAKVVPLGATKAEWLKLAGEAERNFSAGETHQMVVAMKTPPGTAAGRYQFRLNVMSVQNPDDDFAEGPALAFEVRTASAPPPPEKKPFPWFIIILIAILVVGGVVTFLVTRPSKVLVENLGGKKLEEATQWLATNQLRLGTVETNLTGTNRPGTVAAQSVEPGKEVKKDSAIDLIIEGAVPAVVGQTVIDATQLLQAVGLVPASTVTEVSTTDQNLRMRVKEQKPAAGASAKAGSPVSLTVWVYNPTPPPAGTPPTRVTAHTDMIMRAKAYYVVPKATNVIVTPPPPRRGTFTK